MLIAMALTRNLYKYIPITIYSLKKHNPNANIIVFAEDDYIDNVENVVKIQNDWLTEGINTVNNNWTYMSLVRLYLDSLTMADKILWLDVDIICQGSLQELWDIDMGNNLVAMCQEPKNSFRVPYYNSGVCLMNLKQWREEGYADKCKEYLKKQYLAFKDQDTINHLCRDRIIELDSKYNACQFTKPCSNPIIKHYAYRKGWDLHDSLYEEYKQEYMNTI